jgi:hypothetical protein
MTLSSDHPSYSITLLYSSHVVIHGFEDFHQYL